MPKNFGFKRGQADGLGRIEERGLGRNLHLKLILAIGVLVFLLIMAWWVRLAGDNTMSNINLVVAALIILLIISNRKELS